jgi:hypothetical protein
MHGDVEEMNIKKPETKNKYAHLLVSCFPCRNRSLLRTYCKRGLKQEWDKQKCSFYNSYREDT